MDTKSGNFFSTRRQFDGRGPGVHARQRAASERLQGGLLTKARSGDLLMPLPVGLVYDPVGRVVLDPDQGVRDAVAHLFATFARTGSVRATLGSLDECASTVHGSG